MQLPELCLRMDQYQYLDFVLLVVIFFLCQKLFSFGDKIAMIGRVSKLARVAGHPVDVSPHRKFAGCAARGLIRPGRM